jgi:hypothetical protein
VPRVTDSEHSARAAGRHPFDGKSFRQRVTARRGARGTSLSYLRPAWLTRIRQDSRCADVVEAGSRNKIYSRHRSTATENVGGHHFPCASHPCDEINLDVKRASRSALAFLRRVEDERFLPTGKHPALPTRTTLTCPLADAFKLPTPKHPEAIAFPPAQPRCSEAAHLAFGLRPLEIVDRGSCLFRRLEHGSEPSGHL